MQQSTTTAPPPPQPAPAQPAAGNNNNNNNEFEQENDLLGILNMLVELFVLCSIIYFYSTFSRFVVVFLIFALLYL
jgi:flagellar biosynthesis protein FliP